MLGSEGGKTELSVSCARQQWLESPAHANIVRAARAQLRRDLATGGIVDDYPMTLLWQNAEDRDTGAEAVQAISEPAEEPRPQGRQERPAAPVAGTAARLPRDRLASD